MNLAIKEAIKARKKNEVPVGAIIVDGCGNVIAKAHNLVETKNDNENLISSGGRVFSVTAIGDNVQDCRQKAYKAVEEINWNKGFYRRDIGKV